MLPPLLLPLVEELPLVLPPVEELVLELPELELEPLVEEVTLPEEDEVLVTPPVVLVTPRSRTTSCW